MTTETRTVAPPDTADALQDHALRVVIDQRITTLWQYRQWCRRQPNSATWGPFRVEYETELRSLLRLVRAARRLSAPLVERADPVTEAAAYEDRLPAAVDGYEDRAAWTEGELAFARG